ADRTLDPLESVPEPLIYLPAQTDMQTTRKVAPAQELERVTVSTLPDVRKVESASYGDAVSWVAIASSRGGSRAYPRTDSWVSVTALAERDGETQTGFSVAQARTVDDLDWETAAHEAAL